jgi:hypothetical protein
MTETMIISFIIFSILFAFIIVPKATIDIAIEAGFEKHKWYFYAIGLNIFALIWLYVSMSPKNHRQKIIVGTLIIIYLIILYGAYAVDKYTTY